MSKRKAADDSPLDKFQTSSRIVHTLVDPIGLDLLREDYRITYKVGIVFALVIIYFVCAGYTCHLYRNNAFQMLEVICMNGLAIPVYNCDM